MGEVLGCGGTIQRQLNLGSEIWMLFTCKPPKWTSSVGHSLIMIYFPFFLFLPSLKTLTAALDVLRSGTIEDAIVNRAGYRQETARL